MNTHQIKIECLPAIALAEAVETEARKLRERSAYGSAEQRPEEDQACRILLESLTEAEIRAYREARDALAERIRERLPKGWRLEIKLDGRQDYLLHNSSLGEMVAVEVPALARINRRAMAELAEQAVAKLKELTPASTSS